jgi:hypothetical protein
MTSASEVLIDLQARIAANDRTVTAGMLAEAKAAAEFEVLREQAEATIADDERRAALAKARESARKMAFTTQADQLERLRSLYSTAVEVLADLRDGLEGYGASWDQSSAHLGRLGVADDFVGEFPQIDAGSTFDAAVADGRIDGRRQVQDMTGWRPGVLHSPEFVDKVRAVLEVHEICFVLISSGTDGTNLTPASVKRMLLDAGRGMNEAIDEANVDRLLKAATKSPGLRILERAIEQYRAWLDDRAARAGLEGPDAGNHRTD